MSSRNTAQSVKRCLLNRSRASGVNCDQTLQFYAMERLLYRLSESPYRNQFTLKGALLLYSIQLEASRPTRDIDLLGRMENDPAKMTNVLCEILTLPVEQPDGIRFDDQSLTVAPTQLGAEYSGLRADLYSYIDTARISIKIDIGFGDTITPAPQLVEFPVQLSDFPSPTLYGYPLETVIAEKVQTMFK